MTERSMPIFTWVEEQCRSGTDFAGIFHLLAGQIDRTNHEVMRLQERIQALESKVAADRSEK